MSLIIGCCPRCGSEMTMRQARRYSGYCSPDCTLDDQELALRNYTQQVITFKDEIDWSEFESTIEHILNGSFTKPWRPHTVFR
jgi:endogenous inhibitor of DNA gyrase (YacG/DUF329 family)